MCTESYRQMANTTPKPNKTKIFKTYTGNGAAHFSAHRQGMVTHACSIMLAVAFLIVIVIVSGYCHQMVKAKTKKLKVHVDPKDMPSYVSTNECERLISRLLSMRNESKNLNGFKQQERGRHFFISFPR